MRRRGSLLILASVAAVGMSLSAPVITSATGVPEMMHGRSLGERALAAVKPQLTGGINEGAHAPAGYGPSAVPALLIQVPWYCLQPTAADATVIVHSTVSTPAGQTRPCTFNTHTSTTQNMVDMAIAYAQQMGLTLQLDLYAGIYAPAWVNSLPVTRGAAGPFKVCDSAGPTHAVCGMIGHFWETNYEQAYAQFMAAAAREYDASPVVRQVDIAGCMTLFDETMLRQTGQSNAASIFTAAGYTDAANQGCIEAEIQAHTVWAQTRSSIALNPYEQLVNGTFTNNEALTEKFINDCRTILSGGRCVLGNESVGNKPILGLPLYTCTQLAQGAGSTDAYLRMYSYIKCAGAPIAYWAATAPNMAANGNTQRQVLSWVVAAGGAALDMTPGYNVSPAAGGTLTTYVSAADLTNTFNPALAANALK